MKNSLIKFTLIVTIAPSIFAKYDNGKFLDFETLRHFSDAEQVKIFRSTNIGKCHLQGLDLTVERSIFVNEDKIARRFRVYLKDNQKSMPQEKIGSDKVIAKSLRDVIDDGDCGEYSSKDIEKNYKKFPRLLGQLDIGFDYFVSLGLNAEEVAKHHYPLKKFLSKFTMGIKELKEVGYSFGEMYKEGISLQDIINESDSLKVLLDDGVPLKVLKSSFKINEFVAAGVGVWSLRSHLGYTASEVKSAGFGIKELIAGGYGPLNDLKPLFTVHDFKAAGYRVWDLWQQLGYSASEIKSAGFGINDMENGGFNPLRHLKPLFTILEFKAAGYGVWTLKHNLEYTAKELLAIGYSKRELLGAGFTETEIEEALAV